MKQAIHLPLHEGERGSTDRSKRSRVTSLLLLLSTCILLLRGWSTKSTEKHLSDHDELFDDTLQDSWSSSVLQTPQCPAQAAPLVPRLPFQTPSPDYRADTARRLSEAVTYPTISYDDNGPVGEDPRWEIFFDFHKWFFKAFADVFEHESVNLTLVNQLGILTTIRGSDPSLKPLLLMSHQDVVPVTKDTLDRWTHPPFSGSMDDQFVYGRGASDCKDLFIAQYEAVSLLFKQGWKPRRTVLLAHGFDEETTGRQGARKLAPYIESLYGPNSLLMVVDEGDVNERIYGTAFALPATTEKGYLDVQVRVGTPGGHSSIPPKHTAIGIMAEIAQAIERKDYAPTFDGAHDPILQFLICAQKYASSFPKQWQPLVKKGDWKGLAKAFAANAPANRALISTTQAIDVIAGGVKVNALPEVVTMLVNHRIAFSQSVEYVQRRLTNLIAPIAQAHGLKFLPFNGTSVQTAAIDQDGAIDVTGHDNKYIQLEIFGEPIEPAPHSPTSGPIWDLFAGSVRHAMKDDENDGKPYIVSPFASTGNTDTTAYWSLTDAIYRYVGGKIAEYDSDIHTVDEKVSIDGHLSVIEWLHVLIQNADAHEGN